MAGFCGARPPVDDALPVCSVAAFPDPAAAPDMRLYRVSIQRWCGEFVCGRVTKAFHDYWRGRDGESLEAHVLAWGAAACDPAAPPARDGDAAPCAWHDFDDVAHVSGALTNDNYIHVEEVTEDADAIGGYAAVPGGYAGSFEIAAVRAGMPEGFLRTVREIEVATGVDNPANPVLVCKSLEKGEQAIAIVRDAGPFELAKLEIDTWDFDGDDAVVAIRYAGEELELASGTSDGKGMTIYLGDLHDSLVGGNAAASGARGDAAGGEAGKAPGRLALFLGTMWPSFSRTIAALFSALGLPLFLLAAVSAAKYFGAADFVVVKGLAARILEEQENILRYLYGIAAQYGFRLPPWLVETVIAYASIGNTVLRAERDDLVAVDTGGSSRWVLLKEAFGKGRVDSLVLAIPKSVRGAFVRLAWPLMALYRLKTPFVVDGPGPSGDIISSSVPRKELKDFAAMVTAAGSWKGQKVYDFRQIVTWHFLIVAAAGYVGAQVLSMVQ